MSYVTVFAAQKTDKKTSKVVDSLAETDKSGVRHEYCGSEPNVQVLIAGGMDTGLVRRRDSMGIGPLIMAVYYFSLSWDQPCIRHSARIFN